MSTSVTPETLNTQNIAGKKNLKLLETTYKRNIESDYTERMQELGKAFSYQDSKDEYWTLPEFSLLYGSSLFEQASDTQKKALNHLYWVSLYSGHVCYNEIATMVYNQMTCGAFFHIGGYETLCLELDLETTQERHHVNCFRQIGERTEMSLYGDLIFSPKLPHYAGSAVLHPQDRHPNNLLKSTISGYVGGVAFSSSAFLASQYYTVRGIRNITGKVREHEYLKTYRALEKQNRFIPVPTEISYYHYLDEAFHTATSQLVSHDLYKDFQTPSQLEVMFANLAVRNGGQGPMQTLSCAIPGLFQDDEPYMKQVLKLLQTPLFGFSLDESLVMMEKCFCHEHEGFHVASRYHQRSLSDSIKYLDSLEFLWPSNRELRLMASATIPKAVKNNVQSFRRVAKAAKQQ